MILLIKFLSTNAKKSNRGKRSIFSKCRHDRVSVFNGEGDGIGGFTIDYFAGYYLFNWYSKGIYHFRDEIIQPLKTGSI